MSIQTEIERIESNIAAAYTALAAKGATMPTAQNSDNLEATINSISMESGMTATLLWTNPNPTSSFAAQTLALALSGYKFVMITYRLEKDSNVVTSIIVPIDEVKYYMSVVYNSRGIRAFTPRTTGIEFAAGYYTNSASGTVASNNNAAIPQNIWGIG